MAPWPCTRSGPQRKSRASPFVFEDINQTRKFVEFICTLVAISRVPQFLDTMLAMRMRIAARARTAIIKMGAKIATRKSMAAGLFHLHDLVLNPATIAFITASTQGLNFKQASLTPSTGYAAQTSSILALDVWVRCGTRLLFNDIPPKDIQRAVIWT